MSGIGRKLADVFQNYFEEAGLEVQAMTTPVPPPDSIYNHPADEILDLVISAFKGHDDGADALYLLGSDWPFNMGFDSPVEWVNNLDSLTSEEKEQILWKNLAKLIGV